VKRETDKTTLHTSKRDDNKKLLEIFGCVVFSLFEFLLGVSSGEEIRTPDLERKSLLLVLMYPIRSRNCSGGRERKIPMP